jgi:pimeloyl-ACP methyl ester carboxylesterase
MFKALKAALKGLVAVAAVVGVALTLVGALQRPADRWPANALGTRIVVSDVPVRYAQAGHGPDVLLLHGSPGSIEDWSPIVGRLTDRLRVTAFDRPGHGYSGGADLPHTPDENARFTLELIRTLGLRNVVLVGHSYGGITGLALAERNPEEIRAFVLVAARGYSPVIVGPLFRVLAVPFFGAGVAAAVGPWIGPGQIDSGIRASFGPNADLIPPGFVARRVAIWNRPTVAVTLSQERVTLAAALDAMSPHYPEIRKPVVLVCGEDDERPYRDVGRLARDIPNARLVTFPNTGHYVQYARPDDLARIIEDAAAAP